MDIATAHPISELPPANPAMIPPVAFKLADVTLYHSFRPGSLAILLGAKGAGKTQCALSACHALLAGNIPWPFFEGCLDDVGNIVYVDAETPYDEFCANLKQHYLDMEKGKRFFGLSKLTPGLPEFCNNFSLTDQFFRDGLRRYLMEHQCRFVFLDNLTALMAIVSIRANLHKMFLRGLKSSRRTVYVLSLSTTNQNLSLHLPAQTRREEAKYSLSERGRS